MFFEFSQVSSIIVNMNNVLAIVVTYNRLEMLKSCVDCLKSQTFPCDILIVDNASTDGTRAWAAGLNSREARQIIKTGRQETDPADDTVAITATMLWDENSMHHVIYENTGANLGGAGGFNYGMRRSVELGYTYAWVMDDDAFAQPDCLEKLMQEALRLEDFGFLASAVLWKDGSLCRMNWQRKYPTPKKRSERHLLESDLDRDLVRIQSATFVSALFPTKVICQAGLPIREFFIWCDDIEFTRRITLQHGLPAYVVTASRITHQIKNNEGTNLAMDDAERIDRYNYAFRNENYMYRQYGLKGFCYYLVVIGYNTLKVLTKSRDHKLKRLRVIYRNLFRGLAFNPKIEYPKKITRL